MNNYKENYYDKKDKQYRMFFKLAILAMLVITILQVITNHKEIIEQVKQLLNF